MRSRLSQEESHGNAGDFSACEASRRDVGRGGCVKKISHADIRNAIVFCIRSADLEMDFFIIQLVQ